jgi:predicted nuclease of predicted toxin-antitoxin system
MKLLLDQDVWASTARFLRDLGHDVTLAAEIGCARADDTDLLEIARQRSCIFLTRDRDFGGLVFVKRLGTGVIYLRILPSNIESTHQELERVLNSFSEDELKRAFVVVEPGRHRFRKLPQ